MVLNLDYFSREEIQLPENQVSRGPKGQNIEVDDKQEHLFFSPLWSRIAEGNGYVSWKRVIILQRVDRIHFLLRYP